MEKLRTLFWIFFLSAIGGALLVRFAFKLASSVAQEWQS